VRGALTINMTRFMMVLTASAAVSIFMFNATFADDVPRFDVKRNCNVDVTAYRGDVANKTCVADEQRARKTLVAQWKSFPSASRAQCTQMVSDISGSQSYIELLTCLQMAQDVKKLPK